MSDKEKCVDICIDETLNLSRREWLVTKLESDTGILSAVFSDDNHHLLTVRYEADRFSHTTLLDTIACHRVHAKLAKSHAR